MNLASRGDEPAATVGCFDDSSLVPARSPIALSAPRSDTVYRLLILNILFQVFDGLATYHGMHLGFGERNPLLRGAFAFWGVGPTLLLCKSFACVALVMIWATATPRLATWVFCLVAAVYLVCSLVPWSWGLWTLLVSIL